MRPGADDFLEKPAAAEAIQTAMERALAFRSVSGQAKKMTTSAEHETILLNAISSIVIGVGADGCVTLWNAEAKKVFGVSPEKAIGHPFIECAISWHWETVLPEFEEFRGRKKSTRLRDIPFIRSDGREGVLGITINPLPDGPDAGEGFLLQGADITKRRILEAELSQAQKLESIGQLAAGIAHEINTPTQFVGDNICFLQNSFNEIVAFLTQLKGAIDSARKKSISPGLLDELERIMKEADIEYLTEEAPAAIQQSIEGIERIAKIVRAMKEFSHPSGDEKSATDINRAIESTVTVARNEWKYVAELELELDDDLPLVPCLPGKFNQVILNLIINASHAIRDALGEDTENKGRIVIGTKNCGDYAEIRMADTGTGIPEKCRSRIFDPFFTTKDVGVGTGQGLAIARSVIMDKHSGSLTFETECGRGTTFILRLPFREV